MHDALTIVMITASGLSIWCVMHEARRPYGVFMVLSMGLMLMAMIDLVVTDWEALPVIVWALLLVLCGPLMVALGGSRTTGSMAPDTRAGEATAAMALHRGLTMIMMGALVLTAADHHGVPPPNQGIHAHASDVSFVPLLMIAYCCLSVFAVHRHIAAARGSATKGRNLFRQFAEIVFTGLAFYAMSFMSL